MVSMMTTSPACSVGSEKLLDVSFEDLGVDRPIEDEWGDNSFEPPCGHESRRFPMAVRDRGDGMRSPLGARPHACAPCSWRPQVSSMKTSFSGSRSSSESNQARRRFRISGRSCSVACADFF